MGIDEKQVEKLKKRQLEYIVEAIQNLGGLAPYSKIYDEYARLTGNEMTVGRKAGIRKTIEQNSADSEAFSGNAVFYTPQKGSGIWGISEEYQDQKTEKEEKAKKVVKREKHTLPKRARTPKEKLYKKIYREFDRVKYIGDIAIDDDEYAILLNYIRIKFGAIGVRFANADDPIYAVALVQIGIREYNGRYWPHASRLAGLKLDGNKQKYVGQRFYNTLLAHDKVHLDEKEYVNNILMHCFVTKHYAADFFEFLFAYYNYDLGRDLDQHTPEMRDNLIACMKKAEESSRAFRIKKGTADAAISNEKGCKIRIINILKWMDAYLFDDTLPENSPNRTAQFFVEWAKTSKNFKREKNEYTHSGSRGRKQFRSPYLHFDYKNEQFKLVLPVQTVPLDDGEEIEKLIWKISYRDTLEIIDSEVEPTVTGCKNLETECLLLKPQDIFSSFKIELLKNGVETVKRFPNIKDDSARFFDKESNCVFGERLHSGLTNAFTKRDEKLISDSELQCEPWLGLDFYRLELADGSIVKKPDGSAISVGKDIAEGLMEHSLIEGAYLNDNENEHSIFNAPPKVIFKMKEISENGTLLYINNSKQRFDVSKCIVFNNDNSEYNYYLLDLKHYCQQDGVYSVIIDVPTDRKQRKYNFALFNGFEFEFLGAPYIFKNSGKIRINTDNQAIDYNGYEINNTLDFIIENDTDILTFEIGGYSVVVDVPVFKWKFELDEEWNIDKPDEIWYKELPNYIYVKYPVNPVRLHSNDTLLDCEDKPVIDMSYSDEHRCLVCNTRKVLSWLETGTAIHNLYIDLADAEFEFLSVVTRCILESCVLQNDITNKLLEVKSTILGFADCVADIYCDGDLIADKIALTSNGVKIKTDKLFGNYEVVFYENDDEEETDDFDFGTESLYSEFARKSFTLENKNSILGKKISADYITKDKIKSSIFSADKYEIRSRISIAVEKQDDEDEHIFYGVSKSAIPELNALNIQIELLNIADSSKALLLFYDENEECYVDFLYNKKSKALATNEASGGTYLEYDNYYHIYVEK